MTATQLFTTAGAVANVTGSSIEVRGLRLRVGDLLSVQTSQGPQLAEVVAVGETGASALLFGDEKGIGQRDRVTRIEGGLPFGLSRDLVGRVIDAMGNPIDGGPPIIGERADLDVPVPNPMHRSRIDSQLSVGVKLIDTLCATGRGQRLGIFGGSGVGKSTLLGMMARGTNADVTVVGLVGERGREVREFIEDELGPEGMARSVVIVATSDQPALLRLRAGFLAARISEWFADHGADVMLLIDSLTRLSMAQREIGLAAGEPPTARGFTPSSFAILPQLLERAGPRANGTVTGFYSILVDADDMNDPIADAARSILDGHIVLDRRLANEMRYPAIDPLGSLSRLATKIAGPDHTAAAAGVRNALAAANEVRDLVEVGAYVPGTNPRADLGLAAAPALIDFFRQPADQLVAADESVASLIGLCGELGLMA